eukprot:1604555-Rhodomonas_salina.3
MYPRPLDLLPLLALGIPSRTASNVNTNSNTDTNTGNRPQAVTTAYGARFCGPNNPTRVRTPEGCLPGYPVAGTRVEATLGGVRGRHVSGPAGVEPEATTGPGHII